MNEPETWPLVVLSPAAAPHSVPDEYGSSLSECS
ncbi:hypothetical protein A13O_04841, partial [Escherichia coli KTE189]